MANEEDIMSMSEYSIQDMLATLVTKDCAHTINPYFLVSNIDFYGHYIKTSEDKCRIMIGGEFDHLIFRGQNKDYDFIPSFQRINSSLEKCISWIKKEEFKKFFKETPFFQRLPKEIGIINKEFEFDLEALAQHYEFKTDYLDITKNFNIALFFAYTDYKNGQYIPIDCEDKMNNYNPCIYISNIMQLYNTYKDKFKVVGFQVSPRPFIQSAMALDLEHLDGAKSLFTKIELPKNNYFSVGVYNSFKKGYELFHPDILTPFVFQIKTQKIILPSLLQKYCELFDANYQDISKELIANNYTIQESNIELTKFDVNEMNRYINEFVLPFVAKNIGYRRISKEL